MPHVQNFDQNKKKILELLRPYSHINSIGQAINAIGALPFAESDIHQSYLKISRILNEVNLNSSDTASARFSLIRVFQNAPYAVLSAAKKLAHEAALAAHFIQICPANAVTENKSSA